MNGSLAPGRQQLILAVLVASWQLFLLFGLHAGQNAAVHLDLGLLSLSKIRAVNTSFTGIVAEPEPGFLEPEPTFQLLPFYSPKEAFEDNDERPRDAPDTEVAG